LEINRNIFHRMNLDKSISFYLIKLEILKNFYIQNR
jgi:hypothetical protein